MRDSRATTLVAAGMNELQVVTWDVLGAEWGACFDQAT
jgi:hypothetical protein